jgi:hypothetical protein
MNLSLDNNVNKFVLLLVGGVIVLLVVNMNKTQLGNKVSTILSVLVIVVCGYFGYTLLNQENETFKINPYETDSPGANYETFNNYEHFQAEADAEAQEAQAQAQAELDAAQEAQAQAELEAAAEDQAAAANQAAAAAANQAAAAAPQLPPPPQANNISTTNALVSSDLLPSSGTQYSNTNPDGLGGITSQSLLNAGHHAGVNTQGCSMRNANRGLRSEPPNPQVQVGPWMQTTICPDLYRKPLDGQCDQDTVWNRIENGKLNIN